MVKILFLIDDDQDDREIFSEAIVKCDPEIELMFAPDGIEALRMLKSGARRPDVIFLDYNMPRMNGLECLKKLKADAELRSIPTIMYTTSADPEQEKVVLSLGADYYMQKTPSFEALCVALKRVLEMVSNGSIEDS